MTITADPLMRPEVLTCQERAESLRVESDATFDMDHPLCYDAWRLYPHG